MRQLMTIVLILCALVPFGETQAKPMSDDEERIDAKGEYTFDLTMGADGVPLLIATPLGENSCLVSVHGTHTFTGTLAGSGPVFLTVRSAGPCDGSPPFTYPERLTVHGQFVGTVDGRSGSFGYLLTQASNQEGQIWGKLKVLGGEGGLANLRGTLRITSTRELIPNFYTGRLRFED